MGRPAIVRRKRGAEMQKWRVVVEIAYLLIRKVPTPVEIRARPV